MKPTTRSAVLLGATGLVGHELLEQLLADDRFSSVVVLHRRTTGQQHEKLTEHLIDFDRPETFRAQVTGDVLFSALGTTLKTAGSKEAQYKVDHTYQLEAAKAARQNGATSYVLVSSAGASPDATVFYSRMKGELERDVEALGFPRLRILRPGPLDGARQERRTGERVALRVLRPLSPLLPAAARPVHVSIVARACIAAALDETPGVLRYEPKDIFRVGEDAA